MIIGQKNSMTDYIKDITGLKCLLYLELIMSSISFGKAIADSSLGVDVFLPS